jgi:hypothetical protein
MITPARPDAGHWASVWPSPKANLKAPKSNFRHQKQTSSARLATLVLCQGFSREPPFLQRGLSYMKELPPEGADSQQRMGGVDGDGGQ